MTDPDFRACAAAGVGVLQRWYDQSTGQWTSAGWWNAANALKAPNPSSGGPCSAGPDAASTSRTPLWLSPHWSPTAPPRGNHTPASPPGPHDPSSIVHLLVRAC